MTASLECGVFRRFLRPGKRARFKIAPLSVTAQRGIFNVVVVAVDVGLATGNSIAYDHDYDDDYDDV